jgi:hypothetical protein
MRPPAWHSHFFKIRHYLVRSARVHKGADLIALVLDVEPSFGKKGPNGRPKAEPGDGAD